MLNPSVFLNELECLYTARDTTKAFRFFFGRPSESRGDEGEILLDKLRKDLVFMWRSYLYSDIKISISGNFSSVNHEPATAVFSSHRFMLTSRCPYFRALLESRDRTTKAAASPEEEEPTAVTLPSPPFTPASLHFTLGYIYTGTLAFSARTYDLNSAFHVMRSAIFLSLPSLYDETQARIVEKMMHGLCHAFLECSEYDLVTGGKWGTGGCKCRQCVRRLPRVLGFAIAEDVKNQYLERGAIRALICSYGKGWCTPEFSDLPEKIKARLLRGLASRTTPANIFPLLFATQEALRKLSTISDVWSGSIMDMVVSERRIVDEVLCNQADECFEKPEWLELMAEDGTWSNNANRVKWVMDSVGRGLNDRNAPLVYQVGGFLSNVGERGPTNS